LKAPQRLLRIVADDAEDVAPLQDLGRSLHHRRVGRRRNQGIGALRIVSPIHGDRQSQLRWQSALRARCIPGVQVHVDDW